MKIRNNKFLSIILVITMILQIIPLKTTTVSAAGTTTLYIADGTTTDTITVAESSTGAGWSYNKEEATLTLNGFNGTYIESDGDLTIKLSGTNRITPSNDKDYAINVKGLLTIDKTADDITDKLIIENQSMNTDYFVAVVANSSTSVNNVIQIGSTVEINIKDNGYSQLTGAYDYEIGNEANLNINLQSKGQTNGVRNLTIKDNADVTINVKVTDNFDVYGATNLEVTTSGIVNITAESANEEKAIAITPIHSGTIAPKKGGIVTLNGRVKMYNTDVFQPASDYVEVTPSRQVVLGSVYTAYYCCDESGNPITHMTYKGTDEKQQVTFTGEEFFAIPAGKVGSQIEGKNLSRGIGGCFYATFEILEGSFPEGINLSREGYLYGTPKEECEASRVKIRAQKSGSSSSIDYVDFYIEYGAMTVAMPVIGISLDRSELILNVNESDTLIATVLPEDATISGINWSSSDNTIASVSQDGTVTALRAGKVIITATTKQGAKTATATVYVKNAKPNMGIYYYSEELNNFVIGASYTISGDSITTETFTATDTTLAIKEQWFGKTLSIVRNHEETKCNSDPQLLEIAERGSAPTGINVVSESYFGANDGKITAVNSTMEYRKGNSGEFIKIVGDTISNLAVGSYEIRYRSTSTSFASKSIIIEIQTQLLQFDDSADFDIPEGNIATEINTIDVSNAVTGGKKPYTFTKESGPQWLNVSADGKITGVRPNEETDSTTATIKVTDADGVERTITIEVGKVTKPLGYMLSGKIVSFGNENDVITIQIIEEGMSEPSYEIEVIGNNKTYSIDKLPVGTYTLRVIKENHVTRQYTVTIGDGNVVQDLKIHLIGDINGDGKVNISDLNKTNLHVKKVTTLTDYEFACADINGDGKVNISDINRMNLHVKKVTSLW